MRIASRSRRPRRAIRNLGLIVVAAAAFLLVADVARLGIIASRNLLQHDSVAASYAALDTQRCVQRKIDRLVPPGAAIAVASRNVMWRQRARQGSYRRYHVTTKQRATYFVTLTGPDGPCDLVDVQVSSTN